MLARLDVRYADNPETPAEVTVGLAEYLAWADHSGNESYRPLLSDWFHTGWAYVAWLGFRREGLDDTYEEWAATVVQITLSSGKAPAKKTAASRRSRGGQGSARAT